MNNNKNLAEYIKNNYSLDFKSTRWLTPGGEILKYIGSPVVFVKFDKSPEGKWTSKTTQGNIKSISDWDPMTSTYKIKYVLEEDPEKEITERIVPEGFVFNNPEEDNWAKRFVPYSLHMKMTEEEVFFKRLGKLFLERPSIPINQLSQIRKNKDSLEYFNYIAAIIDTQEGINCGICSFRIKEITLETFNKKDNTWSFGIKDQEGHYYPLRWKQGDDFIKLTVGGVFIGNLKILDVED